MKTLGKVAGCFVGLVVCALNLRAAEVGSNQISVRLGAAFPTSANNFSDSAKTGFAGGVQYLRHLSPKIGVGVQTDYFSFAGKDRSIVLPTGTLDANSDSDSMTAELVGRYSFRAEKKLCPYLLAGVGVAHFSQKTMATPKNGTTWTDTGTREERTVADDSSTSYALSFGAGVETKLTERFTGALETNWHIFGVDSDKFGADAINVPSLFARLGWLF